LSRVQVPSDAQASFLALIKERNDEGHEVEWLTTDDYRPSRACLRHETVDREKNTSTFHCSDNGTWQHRIATLDACARRGWVALVHERTVQRRAWDGAPVTWHLRQIDLTEDGFIALGMWREHKLKSPPPPRGRSDP
jgi:hypothetical protein